MGSIIGHRIHYNGVGVLRDQRHIPRHPLSPPPLPRLEESYRGLKDQEGTDLEYMRSRQGGEWCGTSTRQLVHRIQENLNSEERQTVDAMNSHD